MALWPFRRKSARKRSRGAALSDTDGQPRRVQNDSAIIRATSKKKQRTEPAKLQRRQRAYSFSPGRNDSIRVDRTDAHHGGPLTTRQDRSRTGNPALGDHPAWERTPTLHHRRSDQPARRKSSKRRREDHDREAEIKAMSNFMPTRPAADTWTAGHVTKQGSKRTKTMGFGRHPNHPMSETSLPLDSLHSSISTDSDFISYKISALDALAPRPTLRYAPGSRWTPSRNSAPVRPGSQGKMATDRDALPEDALDAHKRIDDLVDGLDARELRELMERDNRRRARKRQSDQERMERRLARRAEKQKAEAAEARNSGSPPPANLERGVLGRELVGLGIEPSSSVVTSSRKRESGGSDPMSDVEETISKDPLESFHRTDTIPNEGPDEPQNRPTPLTEPEEAVSALPQASKLAGLLRSKKSRSKSTLASEKEKNIIAEDEASRKGSEASTKAARLSFTSFLRWGGRNRRNSGPSSFSNTSREEMQAAASAQAQVQGQNATHAQAAALARLQGEEVLPTTEGYSGNYMSSKPGAGVPKRTRSRFREDLPDFPISPPDSRVQSPEAEPPLPKLATQQLSSVDPQPTNIEHDNVTAAGFATAENSRSSPSLNRVYGAASADPHQSISLASIDSEGSWLSGKVGSRRTSTIRDSIAKANRRDKTVSTDSIANSTQEDMAIADDEYLSRLTPNGDSTRFAVEPLSEEGLPSSDEDESMGNSDVKWGAVGAHPEVVHSHTHDREKMHSRQGMLNIDSGDDDDNSSPISPVSVEKADVQRATSVNLGKHHARNFSAGSAKLLDITPRQSIDSKGRKSRDYNQWEGTAADMI